MTAQLASPPWIDQGMIVHRMPAILMYTLCFAPVIPKHYSNYAILGIAVKSLKGRVTVIATCYMGSKDMF